MNSIIQTERIKQHSFTFMYEDGQRPLIEYQGESYDQLTELVKKAAVLSDPHYLRQFIKIANFLLRGLQFDVIEDTADFQQKYQENANNSPPEYGFYDVSSIHAPEVREGDVIFFAEQNTSGVPYRVTCTYPFTGEFAHYAYSLLKEKQRS